MSGPSYDTRYKEALATIRRIIRDDLPDDRKVFGSRKMDIRVQIAILAYKFGYIRPLMDRAGLAQMQFAELEDALAVEKSIRFRRRTVYIITTIVSFIPGFLCLAASLKGILSGRVNAGCWVEKATSCAACNMTIAIQAPGADVQFHDYTIEAEWSYYRERMIPKGSHFQCCPDNFNCCDFVNPEGVWCDQWGSKLGQTGCPTTYPWQCSYFLDTNGDISQLDMAADTSSYPTLIASFVCLGLAVLRFPLYPGFRRFVRWLLWKWRRRSPSYVEPEKLDQDLVIELCTSTVEDDFTEDDMQNRKPVYDHEKAMRPIIEPLVAPITLSEAFPHKYAAEEPNPAVFMDAWELSQWKWPQQQTAKQRALKALPRSEMVKYLYTSVRRKTQRNQQGIVTRSRVVSPKKTNDASRYRVETHPPAEDRWECEAVGDDPYDMQDIS